MARKTRENTGEAIRVGVLGDFNKEYKSHWATNAAIRHSQAALRLGAETVWIPTPLLLTPEGEAEMERCDGLWGSPGSPYASFDGMLRGIEFARTRNWPFVAT